MFEVRKQTHICCGQEHAPIQQQTNVAGTITAILVEKRRSINNREEEVDMLKVASHELVAHIVWKFRKDALEAHIFQLMRFVRYCCGCTGGHMQGLFRRFGMTKVIYRVTRASSIT